jgi:hypothetical protein
LGGAKFILFHSNNPDSPDAEFLEAIIKASPHEIVVARSLDVKETMDGISKELKARSNSDEQSAPFPAVFVLIHGLQKFKKLRNEEEFNFSMGDSESASPGAQLNDLISEGASHGIHLIVTVDTFNNVNRFMSRKALSEFEMRVIFQMSANDSASLIDSPKASNLGLHRALFYNEQEGHLETFRPYALPEAEWIRQTGTKQPEITAATPLPGFSSH